MGLSGCKLGWQEGLAHQAGVGACILRPGLGRPNGIACDMGPGGGRGPPWGILCPQTREGRGFPAFFSGLRQAPGRCSSRGGGGVQLILLPLCQSLPAAGPAGPWSYAVVRVRKVGVPISGLACVPLQRRRLPGAVSVSLWVSLGLFGQPSLAPEEAVALDSFLYCVVCLSPPPQVSGLKSLCLSWVSATFFISLWGVLAFNGISRLLCLSSYCVSLRVSVSGCDAPIILEGKAPPQPCPPTLVPCVVRVWGWGCGGVRSSGRGPEIN